MSYNQYQGYSGNPYGDNNASGGYGSNPYAQEQSPYNPDPSQESHVLQPGASYESQTNGAPPNSGVPAPPAPSLLSQSDFLARVEAAKADIRALTTQISSLATAHQRTLSSTDSSASSALEALTTETQVLNTRIKDQIKFLERDAVASSRAGPAGSAGKGMKDSQVGQLKSSFRKQLDEFQREEAGYEKRYREQIARQYRIVNPEASEEEVREAADADWGSEGVFQTALKTNRTATASTVLGAVRARHADIQRIERTLQDLQLLFQQLAEEVVLQDAQVTQTERQTEDVMQNTQAGNKELTKGVDSAKRARKLKWWCFWIVVVIVLVLALVLGLVFGLQNRARQAATGTAKRGLMVREITDVGVGEIVKMAAREWRA
ncbi:Syntaxin-like protein psy1 [Sphaceloma murrayae]|uniref:Syntaxin-like protein psy1 n=1 Tax=Sphaceloma murrayae TaxID=2082308 RepID=A0A2K1QZ93_9PEZI|nr:Syntaxin-like protein psy1 [Sphaceloma murrayae]